MIIKVIIALKTVYGVLKVLFRLRDSSPQSIPETFFFSDQLKFVRTVS